MIKRTLFATILLLACSLAAHAYDFMVDGLCYNRDSDGKSVTVTYENSDSPRYTSLSGDVEIPPSVTYGGKTYSVTSIGYAAFWRCSGLTSVTIPNSVTLIGENALRGCTGLKSVTIPNSVTAIGDNAFYYCTGLTSVTIGNSVTSIGRYAFAYCSGLTSINISNSVTEIGDYALGGTAWYDNQPDGLVYAGLVTYKYKGTMPAGTNITIKDGTKGIAGSAFESCGGLTSVTIPYSVISIGNYAFGFCSGLTSVTIPNSVTSIGESAFNGCIGLTSVNIPNSVTSIGSRAFYNCYRLTSVTISNSVTSIGGSAFFSCSGLTRVMNLALNPQPIDSGTFDFVDVSACKLLVPQQSVSLYKDAPYWKDFGTISAIVTGDLNDDGQVNSGDVSALYAALISGTNDLKYDINSDGNVNTGDVSALYAIILGN